MIKIRYSDLPAGLHVRTVVQGRDTILYLLPGLSTAERRAAVHRARSNARVGHGPRVPAAGVAFALGADRVRSTVRNGLSAARLHPAFFVPATTLVLSVAVTYLLLASVSIRLHAPQAGPGRQLGVPLPTAPSEARSGAPARAQPVSELRAPRAVGRASARPGRGRAAGRPRGRPPPPHPSPFTSASSAPPGSGPAPTPSPPPEPGILAITFVIPGADPGPEPIVDQARPVRGGRTARRVPEGLARHRPGPPRARPSCSWAHPEGQLRPAGPDGIFACPGGSHWYRRRGHGRRARPHPTRKVTGAGPEPVSRLEGDTR